LNENKLPRNILIVAIVALLSTAGYVLGSHLYYKIGYPLDDAWIYQTYARNLSQLGEWSFIPGKASGGSTGPVWVIFISAGYLIHFDHRLWSYLLGGITLFGIGTIAMYGFKRIQPKYANWAIFAGLILVLDWHLVWASASGMETLLAATIATFTLVYLLKPEFTQKNCFLLGILIGMSIWIRPDGITLLGPAGIVVILGEKFSVQLRFRKGLLLAAGFSIPFGLYLIFNQITAGTIWPNTFYAKQAEYAILRNLSIFWRFGQQFIVPLAGVGIALLPGFLLTAFKALKKKNWAILAGILWFISYLAIYAFRLPVTYQHGRYIIPAIPIYLLFSTSGMTSWILTHLKNQQMILRVLAKVWFISSLSILGLFWILGAKAYAEDVAIIESEMVTTALWVRENTSNDALIGAHDIGALGYFGDRDIIDLAGLISPDVIPFIRDEILLAEYLDTKNVDYLMTFPDWYSELPKQSVLIFQTQGTFSPALGGENMAIYRWKNTTPE
jgi:hypothetical protein